MKKLSENLKVDPVIEPDAYGASTVDGDWVSMGKYDRLLALVEMGTLGASATLNCKLQQATDSGGSGAKDISGKAIVQASQASGHGDEIRTIDLQGSELDVNGGFCYVRAVMVVGTDACDCGVTFVRQSARFAQATLPA
jgi:hypothetical protein